MALLSNSPNFGQIYWRGLIVNHDNVMHQIKDANTNKKYIYWTITNPTQLLESNKKLDESLTRILLFVNDKGMAITVPNENVILTWDGNNEQLVRDKIFGIYEDLGEHSNKFVAIEQNIDGLTTTVGNNKTELLEEISKIDQKADSIDLSVKKVEKEFGDNKELNELRENFNKSTIDFNSQLGLFKSDINSFFTDNRVTSEEKNKINEHIRILEGKRDTVIVYLDKIIILANEQSNTAQQSAINSAKSKFINSVTNLKTYITTSISDGNITPSELTGIIDLFAKCNLAVIEMKNTVDEFLFLGAGGVITEELAKIGIKSNEIELSVSDLKTYTDAQIKVTSDNINLTVSKKVGKDEVVSSINQSAEGIKISASKVNLSGLVTISDLSGNGTTVINGANIKTGTLSADKISGGTINGNMIKGGELDGVTVRIDGGGTIRSFSVAGIAISGAGINLNSGVYNITMNSPLEMWKSPILIRHSTQNDNGYALNAKPSGEFHVNENNIYNSYSSHWVSSFKANSNGDCAVGGDFWADDICSRIIGGSIFGRNYSVVNHWDILDSFEVVSDEKGLRLATKDSKNKYTTFLNPCLSQTDDDETILSYSAMLATLVNSIKELKNKYDKLSNVGGV